MTAYLGSMHDSPIWQDVADERYRQDTKWGDQSANLDTVWATVLAEETGEASQAALHVEFHHDFTDGTPAIAHLRKELVQVAAVAVAWIEALDKRRSNPDDYAPDVAAAAQATKAKHRLVGYVGGDNDEQECASCQRTWPCPEWRRAAAVLARLAATPPTEPK